LDDLHDQQDVIVFGRLVAWHGSLPQLTESRHDDLMSLVLVLLYQHSQSRRVHLILLICVSRQQPISTIRRQHSLRTRLWRSRFSDGDVTGFTSDERKWVAVRRPLQIKAGADDHLGVSVVSSDPTMTATRWSSIGP
jgi:hypothetical protein